MSWELVEEWVVLSAHLLRLTQLALEMLLASLLRRVVRRGKLTRHGHMLPKLSFEKFATLAPPGLLRSGTSFLVLLALIVPTYLLAVAV